MEIQRKKKRHKSGRRMQEKKRRRIEREIQAAEQAARDKYQVGCRPQLTTGEAAAPAPSRQDAPGGLPGEGSGESPQQPPSPPQPAQVALFERQRETRADARMARRAILNHWRPKPEATEAVLTKATVMALNDGAKLHEVVAVTKLHLDAHRTVVSDEHHAERMEYHERALQIRTKVGDYIPAGGPPININTGGGTAAVSIFLPAREEIRDDLERLDQP